VAALVGVGAYLWITGRGGGNPPGSGQGTTQAETLAAFRVVMEKKGWESAETQEGFWKACSEYKIGDAGFVSLIEYPTADAASQAQTERNKQFANYPGYQETPSGLTTLMDESQPNAGEGSVEIQFGTYRFEAFGMRTKIDALVADLGYLDTSRTWTDPIAGFKTAVKESGITTSTDGGYTGRSAFTEGEFRAERKMMHTPEDAQADYDGTVMSCESGKFEFGTATKGSARIVWFIVDAPDSNGNSITQYALRAYSGRVMTAVSGPVESRSKVDGIMKELGY
jgi:hypothetical protein